MVAWYVCEKLLLGYGASLIFYHFVAVAYPHSPCSSLDSLYIMGYGRQIVAELMPARIKPAARRVGQKLLV